MPTRQQVSHENRNAVIFKSVADSVWESKKRLDHNIYRHLSILIPIDINDKARVVIFLGGGVSASFSREQRVHVFVRHF